MLSWQIGGIALTDKLKAVIAQAKQLSQKDQDAVAEAMLTLLDELGWEKRFAEPENKKKMQRMAEEALKEHTSGKTEEWP